MKYLITNHKSNDEKQEIQKQGLFCYDLRHGDDGEICTIERGVLVNRAGSIITNEELSFGNTITTDMIYFDEFCEKNIEVYNMVDLKETSIDERDWELANDNIKKVLKEIDNILQNNEEYIGMKICYILQDKKDKKELFAVAMKDDEILEITLPSKEVDPSADWAYNIDDDIFGRLQDGDEIIFMSILTHGGIWETINNWYPDDVENKKGMQEYLKYCKRNGITKAFIDKKTGWNDIPDIMKYYKNLKNKER